jgi:hypothetical protein
MKLQVTPYRLTALAALALTFAFSAGIVRAQYADSEEISALLTQAKSHVVQMEDDAAVLDSFARSKLSWKSHANKLNQIREHINSLGQVNKQLTEKRTEGSPWQQKAIDQIDPLLHEMASTLTGTINHLNQQPSRIHMREYREYAHSNHELASKTARMIRDFVDYDEAKAEAEALEARLELPTAGENNE